MRVEGSTTETYQLRREQAKCLHCRGNHHSAGHEGLRGDVAAIKSEQLWDKPHQFLEVKKQQIVKESESQNTRLDFLAIVVFYGKSVKIDSDEWCQDIFF